MINAKPIKIKKKEREEKILPPLIQIKKITTIGIKKPIHICIIPNFF